MRPGVARSILQGATTAGRQLGSVSHLVRSSGPSFDSSMERKRAGQVEHHGCSIGVRSGWISSFVSRRVTNVNQGRITFREGRARLEGRDHVVKSALEQHARDGVTHTITQQRLTSSHFTSIVRARDAWHSENRRPRLSFRLRLYRSRLYGESTGTNNL